ncbi:hypothetical protein I553_5066 [Mycobacterium xenopi 4042]|uniref:Uncharacterized protein n=1 Tax=Mycobacterium xenopi 4042 TaxID=1299334 RepID=X7ZYB8_MYCXE|nr:hypothetical protein I553_5066 [Mycobacterium xenopi 4042]
MGSAVGKKLRGLRPWQRGRQVHDDKVGEWALGSQGARRHDRSSEKPRDVDRPV